MIPEYVQRYVCPECNSIIKKPILELPFTCGHCKKKIRPLPVKILEEVR